MKPRDLTSLTKILGSVHQPLPLNQKESQRLLDTLTKSFRRHLDKEHPGFSPEWAESGKSTVTGAAARALPPPPLTRIRPTDHHVQSILSNPLFSYEPPPSTGAAGAGMLADAGSRPAPQAGRDPMEVFDEAVAKGMMTPMRAAGCLMAKRREIAQLDARSAHAAMAKSGAGRRVVQWLRASGLESSLAFLGNPRLLDQLVLFLLAEGHEGVVWSWMAALAEDEQLETTIFYQKRAKGLLMRLVDFKASNSPSMDDAYACLLRAKKTLPEHWLISRSCPAEEPGSERNLLLLAWHSLNWKSTVLAWQHPEKSSHRLFNQFSKLGHLYLDRDKISNKLELAHLALHHPIKPSHRQAMAMLDSPATWEEWSSQQNSNPNHLIPRTVRLRSLGMDMAQYFVERGEDEQAQSILRVLEDRLGSYFSAYSNALSGASVA